jgi:streptogrisin D
MIMVAALLSVLGVGAAIQMQSQVAPTFGREVEEKICQVVALITGGPCPNENSEMATVGPTAPSVPDLGDTIVTETDSDDPSKTIRGGKGILGDVANVCSAGFNVIRPDGNIYVLTAGHCQSRASSWFFEDGMPLGITTHSAYPPADYGLIRLEPGVRPAPEVTLHNGTAQRINAVGTAYVGQQVCSSGARTKVTCGTVLEVGVTMTLRDGTVLTNLIETNICVRLADSGGPLFAGGTALGIASLGPPVPPTTPCRGPDVEVSYFTPIGTVLAEYGATLLTWP